MLLVVKLEFVDIVIKLKLYFFYYDGILILSCIVMFKIVFLEIVYIRYI